MNKRDLYEKYLRQNKNYIRTVCRSLARRNKGMDMEDLYQESCIKIFKHIEKIVSYGTNQYTLAIIRSIVNTPPNLITTNTMYVHFETFPETLSIVHGRCIHRDYELRETVEEILSTPDLYPKERDCLNHMVEEEVEEFPASEFSREFNIPRGTVSSTWFRAKEKIKQHVQLI